MTLAEAIKEYSRSSYVLQTKGSGSSDPMIINYFTAIDIDSSIAGIELASLYDVCDNDQDLLEVYIVMSSLDMTFELASIWIKTFTDGDNYYRILF